MAQSTSPAGVAPPGGRFYRFNAFTYMFSFWIIFKSEARSQETELRMLNMEYPMLKFFLHFKILNSTLDIQHSIPLRHAPCALRLYQLIE
jgi:hypothetical protein